MAVINDTVGAMMTCGYDDQLCEIGLIVGESGTVGNFRSWLWYQKCPGNDLGRGRWGVLQSTQMLVLSVLRLL